MDGKEIACSLMERSEAVYLTTLDEDTIPQTRAMLNLRNSKQYPDLQPLFAQHEDDLWVYFTTNYSSDKMRQIKNNPVVSVYYCLPKEWDGLMLSGQIEEVTDQAVKDRVWQKGWELYYPQGSSDPDYAVLCLRPKSVTGYHKMERYQLQFEV